MLHWYWVVLQVAALGPGPGLGEPGPTAVFSVHQAFAAALLHAHFGVSILNLFCLYVNKQGENSLT